MSNVSLISLPVELLHRIFDDLDAYTIVQSVRCVRRQFHAVVNSYDRFEFDFDPMSKFCLKVPSGPFAPTNISSLILYGNYAKNGCIRLFLTECNICEFTRLRSLTLYKVSDIEINQFFQHVTINSLVSLTIGMRWETNITTIFSSISSMVAQASLQSLRLNKVNYTTKEIS